MILAAHNLRPTTTLSSCVIFFVSFLMFDRNIGSHLSINMSVEACMGTGSHVTSLEHVQARLTLSYNRRGNLAIHLISPAGTRSTLLHPRPHDYSSEGFNDWAFMTTHSWDEKPSGAWTLEIENVAGASDYGTLTQFILVLYGTGSASSSPSEQAPSGNDNCKTLDLRQICIECNAGYYLFQQGCVKECTAGYSLGSQPVNYTVGNFIPPATCASPPTASWRARAVRGCSSSSGSRLPIAVAILSCMAIIATFAGTFLLLQLRSGTQIKLPSLEGGRGLGGGFSLGGNRVVSYRGIPTVWGDDVINTDSDNEDFDGHNERTAFIKTQSAL
ncbi:Furin-1 [Dissostichus eleginoides]|uniref:Furin-1 n=1 Tax=Dissostichus eleginoides TaxID=100907 RepID=A0AAD9BYL1_DISEL|nr:Furin-1 [Dissostichus eleginoides]